MNWFLSEFNIRAWRLIKNYEPQKAPSITLIYGPRGLGKTAMLHNVYQHVGSKGGSIFTDALSFARQYAYAAQNNKLNVFRQRYRSTQLLLIDDLQFLAGKAKTIEELHYTYEYVIGNGGKMVIAIEADSPQLEFLGERLASRFLSGVVIPIEPPLASEINRFLAEYVYEKHLFVDESVLEVIAERIDNLADAKMVMKNFVQFAELQQDELSLACFQVYWEKEEIKRNAVANPKNIIRIAAQTMGVAVEELLGPGRTPRVNEARQLAIYTIRTLCQISYPSIACYFNRNHNTVLMAFNKMQDKLANDQELYSKYVIILNAFKV